MSEVEENTFELDLENKTEVLKSCQAEHSLNSCLSCKEIIGCKTRKEYIDSVYNSMSQGQAKDFEF